MTKTYPFGGYSGLALLLVATTTAPGNVRKN
ncbi:hypothetical protein AFEL58S_01604 [Afipia felis]